VAEVAILLKLLHPAPLQRKIEYPVTPTLSVDAVQVKPIWVPDAAVATRLPGVDGGVVSAPWASLCRKYLNSCLDFQPRRSHELDIHS